MGRKGPSSDSGSCCRLLWCAIGLIFFIAIQGVYSEHEPTESECRPYIEKALKEHHVEADEVTLSNEASSIEQEENTPTDDLTESNEAPIEEGEGTKTEDSNETTEAGSSTESLKGEEENKTDGLGEGNVSLENTTSGESTEASNEEGENKGNQDTGDSQEGSAEEPTEESEAKEGETAEVTSQEGTATAESLETSLGGDSQESKDVSQETGGEQVESLENSADANTEVESQEVQADGSKEGTDEQSGEGSPEVGATSDEGKVENISEDSNTLQESVEVSSPGVEESSTEESVAAKEGDGSSEETAGATPSQETTEAPTSQETTEAAVSQETREEAVSQETREAAVNQETREAPVSEETPEASASQEIVESPVSEETKEVPVSEETTEATVSEETTETPETPVSEETTETVESQEVKEKPASQESAETPGSQEKENALEDTSTEASSEERQQEVPVEELTREAIIPANLRSREHITQILKLDEESVERESELAKTIDTTLNTLKKLYDNAIKPLEILYKYRDLSNRHFGDPEIFSKPLILFMGPWSGGKSSTINYLLDLEFTELALRTGAEPSPAYFNILTYGEDTEILDGTQLAADWTFSGLQKFGQGLLDRLRGVKLKNRLLEKVNIVEIPGILEIRKQVQRLFPFNDACQWFIDRADIIFLVYDPAKLDVGPETEAILDQLKGREYQTRIILNKADQVKPEELMRVQGTLIWNISPLMSSQEPPVMYTTSLWSLPYESHAPTRLLFAQERAFLRDLREAIDKRVENKIASARRFAVRVRNHAKMVDCYLTTYYNHKTFFGNKKKISDDIIENPTKYHIYEGLSTLTNISRYDLPDPEMYRDFFRINPLYDFVKLSDTCTYFRGCPINKLDIAIAYDLPELVGKYKKAVEQAKTKS